MKKEDTYRRPLAGLRARPKTPPPGRTTSPADVLTAFSLGSLFSFFVTAMVVFVLVFFFQAEDGIRDGRVTGVQTCALPISRDRELPTASLERATLLLSL